MPECLALTGHKIYVYSNYKLGPFKYSSYKSQTSFQAVLCVIWPTSDRNNHPFMVSSLDFQDTAHSCFSSYCHVSCVWSCHIQQGDTGSSPFGKNLPYKTPWNLDTLSPSLQDLSNDHFTHCSVLVCWLLYLPTSIHLSSDFLVFYPLYPGTTYLFFFQSPWFQASHIRCNFNRIKRIMGWSCVSSVVAWSTDAEWLPMALASHTGAKSLEN